MTAGQPDRGSALAAGGAPPVEVRRLLHKTRSVTIENFNEQFKGIFGGHQQVPTRGVVATQRFALGAIFVYQLSLLHRYEHEADLRVGLKAFLKAAKPFMSRRRLAEVWPNNGRGAS